MAGSFAEAIRQYEQALHIDPYFYEVKNNLAWLLATYPEASFRDGKRAVELAERARQQAGEKNAFVLDTLAAAYTEAGRYPEAIKTAWQAVKILARQGTVSDPIRERIELYQKGHPFHDRTMPNNEEIALVSHAFLSIIPAMKNFTPKGEQSRQRILDTSIRLFAEKGFTGVSVDTIVDAANINKRMVYHYFGSKEKLFQAALAVEYSKLEALEIKTLHPEEPIETVLNNIIHAYFSFLQANPEFVQLLLWENLNKGRNLDQMQLPLSKGPMLELLVEAVDAGKKNGTVRQEVDPRFLLISLIGNCMIYCSNRYTLSRALNLDLSSPRTLSQAKEAVTDLLLNGIRA